jgi:methyl-accepting chemotaxis protein PixJ
MNSPADPVHSVASENEFAILQLTQVTEKQTADFAHTLSAVEQMTQSIQAVATNAQQVTEIATSTETEELAINKTVRRLLKLRETVAHTAKKVQQLDASSQKISQVVSLIHQIVLQIPLLSTSTSGKSTPPVEPPDLAQDLTAVVAEIGHLTASSPVVHSTRVVQDPELHPSSGELTFGEQATDLSPENPLESAKRTLAEISEASHTVDQLMQAIAKATVSHVQTSQTVADLMQAIVSASEPTPETAHLVSAFLANQDQTPSHLRHPST